MSKNGYDLMDLVNYILIQMYYGRYNGIQLHYLMIDEVQDLPHNILFLLRKIASEGIFFSGDTAQSIGKGVGFRFCDLNHIFDEEYFHVNTIPPTIHHLTINFRSHNQILQLANSVVTLIEICFPQTIDKMKKEKSNIIGPKPIIIQSQSIEDLLLMLLTCEEYQNKQDQKQEQQQQSEQEQKSVKFGCNQVILVRDQQSKNKLPQVFQNALCLTIYEAKGLEFDDVILFNFFADSTIDPVSWNLIKFVQLKKEFITKEELAKSMTFHFQDEEKQDEQNKQKNEEQNEKQQQLIEEEQKMRSAKEIKNLLENEDSSLFGITMEEFNQLDNNLQIEIKQAVKSENMPKYLEKYSSLCNELKQLYVAITRPKRKLIIFDQQNENRLLFENYWKELGVVEFAYPDQLFNEVQLPKQIDYSQYFSNVCSETQKKEWKLQGLKMLKHKFYEQAVRCFTNSKDKMLLKRANAFLKAENCAKQLLKINNQCIKQQNLRKLTKPEKRKRNQKLVELFLEKMNVKQQLEEAGLLFTECKLNQHAAQCYFTCEKFEKAAQIYEELQLWKQAGESYYILKRYEQAADCFEKTKDYYRIIDCLFVVKNYEKILTLINNYKELMTQEQYQALVDEYLPKYFETFVKKLQMENQFGFQWEKEKQERLEQLKKKQKQWEKYKKSQLKNKEKIMKKKKIMDIIEEEEEQEANQLEQKNKNISEMEKQRRLFQENDQNQEEYEEDSIESLSDFDETELNELEENKRLYQESQAKKLEQEQNEEIQQIEKLKEQKNEESQLTSENIQKLKGDIEEKGEINNIEEIEFDVISENKAKFDFQSDSISISQQEQISCILNEDSMISHITLTENSKQNIKSQQESEYDIISQISLQTGKNEQEEQEKINAQNEYEEMDHLSHINFDDEWLSQDDSKSLSIIDSIASLRKQNSSNTFEQFSEYSSIGYEDILKSQVCLVQTHADIFVQDETMHSIIKYLGMFSEECKAALEFQRSKEILLTKNQEENQKNNQNENDFLDLIVDLDKLTIDTIYLMLDVLESYQLFKLNIFICNRYQLADRIGHYLASIAHRYSPLAKSSTKLNFNKLSSQSYRQSLREQALIANAAVHNVLENINPAFLKLKCKDEEVNANNHLGVQCFQCLILLGYWKKCVYLLDFQNALALTDTFADFYNYKLIFILGNNKFKKFRAIYAQEDKAQLLMKPNFKALPISFEIPKDEYEAKLIIMTLDHLQWEFNGIFGLFVNQNFTEKINLSEIKELQVPAFPNYLYFNGVFWKFLANIIKYQNEQTSIKLNEISNLFSVTLKQAINDIWQLENNQEDQYAQEYLKDIHIQDLITFFFEFLVFNSNKKLGFISNQLFQIFSQLPIDIQLKFFLIWENIVKLFSKCKLQKHELIIRKAILNLFRIREVHGEIMSHLGEKSLLIHETSIIFPLFFKENPKEIQLLQIDLNGSFYLVLDNAIVWEHICFKLNSFLQVLAFTLLKFTLTQNQYQTECQTNLKNQINNYMDNEEALKYNLYQLLIQITLQKYDLLINNKNFVKLSQKWGSQSNSKSQQINFLLEKDFNIGIESILQENNFQTLFTNEIDKILSEEDKEIINIEKQCEEFIQFFSNKKQFSKKKQIQQQIQKEKNFAVSSENYYIHYKTTGQFSMIYYNLLKQFLIYFCLNRCAIEQIFKNEKNIFIQNKLKFLVQKIAQQLIYQSQFLFGKQPLVPILIEQYELLMSLNKQHCLIENFRSLQIISKNQKKYYQFCQMYQQNVQLFRYGNADQFLENTYDLISKNFHQFSILNLVNLILIQFFQFRYLSLKKVALQLQLVIILIAWKAKKQ